MKPRPLPYTITISRQLGAGGSHIGQRLAARLGIAYADREIVRQAALLLNAREERVQRVEDAYGVSAPEAYSLIEASDHDRVRYLWNLTGTDWSDSRQYHLSLNTGVLGLDCAEDIIFSSLHAGINDSFP